MVHMILCPACGNATRHNATLAQRSGFNPQLYKIGGMTAARGRQARSFDQVTTTYMNEFKHSTARQLYGYKRRDDAAIPSKADSSWLVANFLRTTDIYDGCVGTLAPPSIFYDLPCTARYVRVRRRTMVQKKRPLCPARDAQCVHGGWTSWKELGGPLLILVRLAVPGDQCR